MEAEEEERKGRGKEEGPLHAPTWPKLPREGGLSPSPDQFLIRSD